MDRTKYAILKRHEVKHQSLGTIDGELVLCWVGDLNGVTPFATWWRDPATDSYHWGHYCVTLDEAMADFDERVAKYPVVGQPRSLTPEQHLVVQQVTVALEEIHHYASKLHKLYDEHGWLNDRQPDGNPVPSSFDEWALAILAWHGKWSDML